MTSISTKASFGSPLTATVDLAGNGSVEAAAAEVQQASRRYAKRQLTWFRRNTQMHWLIREEGQTNGEILAAARQLVQEYDN